MLKVQSGVFSPKLGSFQRQPDLREAQTTTTKGDTSCRVRTSDFQSPLRHSPAVVSAQPPPSPGLAPGPRTQAQHCQTCGCSESASYTTGWETAPRSLAHTPPALLAQAAPPWSYCSCRRKQYRPVQDHRWQLRASFSGLRLTNAVVSLCIKKRPVLAPDQGIPSPRTSRRQASTSSLGA